MALCGPSSQEKALAASEQSFSQLLQQNYQTQFANQQGVLDTLNHTLSPIVSAGPNQQGFSPQELASMETTAINTTAGNYANAARALATNIAGQTRTGTGAAGAGGTGLETGIQQQEQAQLASNAAGALSNEQLGIVNANYATGRQNFQNATGGLETLSGQYNPLGYAGAGTTAGSTAFNEAGAINQQSQAGLKELAGLATGGLDILSGGLGNLDTTGGSSFGEQVGNFFTGAGA
jgi:hypothetical protein